MVTIIKVIFLSLGIILFYCSINVSSIATMGSIIKLPNNKNFMLCDAIKNKYKCNGVTVEYNDMNFNKRAITGPIYSDVNIISIGETGPVSYGNTISFSLFIIGILFMSFAVLWKNM
jgi:hypothetical protein